MVQEEIYSYLLYSKNTPFHLTKKKKKARNGNQINASKCVSVGTQTLPPNQLICFNKHPCPQHAPKEKPKKEKRRKKIRVV